MIVVSSIARHAMHGPGLEVERSAGAATTSSLQRRLARIAELELRAPRVDVPRLVLRRGGTAGSATRPPSRTASCPTYVSVSRPDRARSPTACRPAAPRSPSASRSIEVRRVDAHRGEQSPALDAPARTAQRRGAASACSPSARSPRARYATQPASAASSGNVVVSWSPRSGSRASALVVEHVDAGVHPLGSIGASRKPAIVSSSPTRTTPNGERTCETTIVAPRRATRCASEQRGEVDVDQLVAVQREDGAALAPVRRGEAKPAAAPEPLRLAHGDDLGPEPARARARTALPDRRRRRRSRA